MAIVRWDPFRDFLSLQNEVGKMFERSFGLGGTKRSGLAWTPAIDAYETKDNIVIKAELPEVEARDVDITLADDTLVIKGERKFSEEVNEEDCYRLERRYGSFQRSIPLPANVKRDEVNATYHDGVLEINLPKSEETRPKEIKVKVEQAK